jgi:protein mago nashi
MSGPSTDPFYLRYYAGHVGSYGHEFLEFELSGGRLRFALNSNYRNEGLIRREMHLSQATLDAIKKIVDASQVVKEDDQNWPKKNVVGKQELEVKLGNYHISFEVSFSTRLSDLKLMC